MPVTLEDIARRTGISRAAVAKVILNNRSNVRVGREKTELIRRTAEEMGYRPNALAQALRSGKTRMIGLVTGGLDSPYFAELLMYAEHIAARNQYQLLVIPVEWDAESELQALESLRASRVDGILSFSDVMRQPEVIHRYEDMPVIPLPGVSEVRMDFHSGMRELFHRAREAGIDRLPFLFNHEAGRKEEAYLDCCREYAVTPEIIQFRGRDSESLGTATDEVIAKGIRHTLVCSDHYAMRFISRLGQLGKSVPRDISVAAIGGTRAGSYYNPPLTTIDQHIAESAEAQMRILFDRIAGSTTPQIVSIATALITGGSFIFERT